MEIPETLLRQAVSGITEMRRADGFFRFYRFTSAASDRFREATATDFYRKSLGTAGVRLCFRTDARRLRFAYRFRKAAAYTGAWFDVLEDGVLRAHFGHTFPAGSDDCMEGEADISLRAGGKDVEIDLPWSAVTEISAPEAEGETVLTPVLHDRRILCVGDSVTHGYYTEYPSLTYPARLARYFGADVINQGIGGDRIHPERLPDSGKIVPDLITVAYGTNDWNFITRAQFRENCTAYLDGLTARYPHTPLLLISPIWRSDGEKETPFGFPVFTVHRDMEEICAKYGTVTLTNGWSFLPHDPALYSDAVHPNSDGFAFYARALAHAIEAADILKGWKKT